MLAWYTLGWREKMFEEDLLTVVSSSHSPEDEMEVIVDFPVPMWRSEVGGSVL
jgi:hypothetical protein